MLRLVGEWAGKSPLNEEDLRAIARLAPDEAEVVEHGRRVVEQTADVQGFVRRWREHFLRAMEPGFLPEHWDVDRPACREGR
jgi:hypothetical protein